MNAARLLARSLGSSRLLNRPLRIRLLTSRRGKLLAVFIFALVVAGGAFSFFTAAGHGAGSARTGRLAAPTNVQGSPGAGTVALSWNAVTPPASGAVNYYVSRGGTPVGGSCGTPGSPISGTSCADTGLSAGTYNYTVTAVWHSWTATSSSATSVTLASGAAAKVVFTTSPGNTSADNPLSPQPQVTVEDSAGNTVVADSSSVTLAIKAGTPTSGGPGSISGCSQSESSGVITFSGCQIKTTGTAYQLHATDDSLTAADSAAFNITPGAANAAQSTLTPTSSSITADGVSTQVLTVQAKDANGNNLTSGGATVTITKSSGTGTIGSVTDNGNGAYTAKVTAPGSPGSGIFVATLSGSPVESGTVSQTQATVNYVAAGTETAIASTAWNVASTWMGLSQTGAITTSTSSTAVTGSGTSFTNLVAGDELYESDGTTQLGQIQSITDNTHLTLTANAQHSVSGAAFTVSHIPTASDAVTISNFAVTIPTGYAANADSVTVGPNFTSTLTFSSSTSTLAVGQNLTVTPGTTSTGTNSVAVGTGVLTVGGNVTLTAGSNTNRAALGTVAGGTVTIGGNLSIGTDDTFDMSGGAGTLNLAGSLTNSGTFTAGSTSTVNFDGTLAQTIPVSSVNFANVTVNNTSASGATLGAAVTASNVTGNLQVQSGTFDNGGFTITGASSKTFSVAASATFKLSGTTSTFPTGFSTFTLDPASTVIYAGTGAQTVAATTSYGNLIVDGGSGSGTKTAGGALTVNGNLTINSGVTFAASTFSHNLKGNFTNNGTFTANTSTMTFSGTNAQTIGGSGATTFNGLTISNSSGVSLSGVDTTVSGTLALGSSILTTGSNKVIVSTAGAVTRSSGFVNGNLQRAFASGSSTVVFDVGSGSTYAPISVSVTGANSGGTLVGSTTASQEPHYSSAPPQLSQTQYVNRYWTLTAGTLTITGYNATFTFVAGDLVGSPDTSILEPAKYNSGWSLPGSFSSTSTTVTGTGFGTTFGNYAAGQDPPVDSGTTTDTATTDTTTTDTTTTDTTTTDTTTTATTPTDTTTTDPTTTATCTTTATTDTTATDTTTTDTTTTATTPSDTTTTGTTPTGTTCTGAASTGMTTQGLSTGREVLFFAVLGGSVLGMVALMTMPIPRRRRARRRRAS